MIFILARSMDAAKQLAVANNILPKDWRYAGYPDNLFANRNEVLWVGAGYKDHPYYQEVLEQAKNRCFRIFEITEVPKYTL